MVSFRNEEVLSKYYSSKVNMILEFWSVGDIEIILLLDKQFMDEYTFETPGTPISELSHSILG